MNGQKRLLSGLHSDKHIPLLEVAMLYIGCVKLFYWFLLFLKTMIHYPW